MPIDDLNSSLIQLTVHVRDQYDCATDLDLSSVTIVPDLNNIVSFMTIIESAVVNSDFNNIMTSNSLMNILYGGNQNDICQILTSIGQVSNLLAQQNLQLAILSRFDFLNKNYLFIF